MAASPSIIIEYNSFVDEMTYRQTAKKRTLISNYREAIAFLNIIFSKVDCTVPQQLDIFDRWDNKYTLDSEVNNLANLDADNRQNIYTISLLSSHKCQVRDHVGWSHW